MFGLELMASGLLHLAATDVKSQIKCEAKIVPKINVVPTKSNVQYDFTKTKNDLSRFDIDTISPYEASHKTHVGGLMSGKIQLKQQTEFMQEAYDHVGYGCVYIKVIDVKIHIDPTIYVAKEHKQGSCNHNEILKHEKKHLREDQLVVNKYSGIIGENIKKSLISEGYSFGPYKISELAKVQKRLQRKIAKLVTERHDEMNLERQERQQAIDSIEEYDEIAARCLKSK